MKNHLIKTIIFSACSIIVHLGYLIMAAKFFFPATLSYINPHLSKFIEYKKIDLKILPCPSIKIIDARSHFSKNISIKINKIDIFLNLTGFINKKPFNIITYNGFIKILPFKKKNKKKKLFVPTNIPIGFIKLNNFKIDYLVNNKNIILKDVYFTSKLTNKLIQIEGAFSSNFVKKVYINGSISHTNKINLTFKELSLKKVSIIIPNIYHIPKKIYGNLDGNIDLFVKNKKIKGNIHIKSSEIRWKQKLEGLDVNLKINLDLQKKYIDLNIIKFITKYPYTSITGKIKYIGQHLEINIDTKKIDIKEVRNFYKNLQINNKLSDKIFSIVTSGYLFNFSFRLIKDKKKLKWNLNGNCQEVNIEIPNINLSLKNLDGHVTIKNNILNCTVKKGFYKHSLIKNGYLSLGLNHNLYPFNINAKIKFDLRDLNSLLNNLPIPQNIISNINKVHIVKGICDTIFTMHKKNKYIWNINISNLHTKGYINATQKVPFNMSIDNFILNNEFFKIKKTNIHLKNTKINNLDLNIDFQKKYLYINFSSSNILYKEAKQVLGIFTNKNTNSLKIQGNIYFDNGLIIYDYLNKKTIKYAFKGHIGNLKFYDLNLKKLIKDIKHQIKTNIDISNGNFSLNSEHFTLINSRISILNSNINLKKLAIDGHILKPNNVKIKLSGNLSQSIKRIIKEKISILKYISIKNNLYIQFMEMNIIPTKYIYLKLDSNINGVYLKTNIKLNKKIKQINGDIILKYNSIYSGIKFIHTPNILNLKFNGKISKDILDRILVKNEYLKGSIDGDCSLYILSNPFFIKDFKGFLNIYKMKITSLYNLLIENMSIKSIKKSILIKKSCINLLSNKIHTNGLITITKKMNYINLNLNSTRILLDPILKILNKTASTKKSNININGKINIDFEKVFYSDRKFKHVSGTIIIDKGFKSLNINNAYLCDVPIKMYLINKNKYMELNLKLEQNALPVEKFFQCMQNTDEHTITGTSNIQLELQGKIKKGTNFIKTLNGKLNFMSQKGRIYRLSLISRILYLINSTEILFGKIPDMKKKGFEYNVLNAKGEIKNGILLLKDSYINGTNMELAFHGKIDMSTKKINIIVLFAPLKTIDRIIKKIPILKNITGGNLVVIPFQVKGSMDSPFLIPLSPKAVGSEVLGILKNTLKLPYKIIQPLIPETKNKVVK